MEEAIRKVTEMPEEIDWVERLRSDSQRRQEALEELLEILLRWLSASLARRGGGESFADDVVQTALIKVLESLDSYAARGRFLTWAMTIATRLGIRELRRRHFQNVSLDQVSGNDDLKVEVAVNPGCTASTQSFRKEIIVQLRQLVEEYLTNKQRKVMQAALSGMPIEEIARRMDMNRNAIYKVFHDARKKLRSGFEARGVISSDNQAVFG